MKALNIIGHYSVVIATYLLLIIEGTHFGGLYMLYILLALPHLVTYAITAIIGIAIFTAGNYFANHKWSPALSLGGLALMVLSIIIFFAGGDNKTQTFSEFIPLLSFVFFGIATCTHLVVKLGFNKKLGTM